MKGQNRILCHAIAALICLLLTFSQVYAQPSDPIAFDGNIEIHYSDGNTGLEGVNFMIYEVAAFDESNVLAVTDAFADYQIDFDFQDGSGMRALAQTIDAYVVRDGIAPVMVQQTDASGTTVFAGLRGLYLVRGEEAVINGNLYTPEPTLICLPYLDEDHNVNYSVSIEPKKDVVPLPEEVSVSVVKVWSDSGREEFRPKGISIELYKDGEKIDTVTLNKDNNWRYSWDGLDAAYSYRVTEESVPEGYTVRIEREEKSFVVTNTIVPGKPEKPDEPKLPQTGMLQWPIPVMAATGIILLLLGLFGKRFFKKNDEDRSSALRRVLVLIGAILIAGAAALFAYNKVSEANAEERSKQILRQMKDKEEETNDTSTTSSDTELFRKIPEIEMPTEKIDGKRYIGVIDIPSLKIELPVLENWSYENLKISPCRWFGSVYQDNMVIAAHNYETHFGKIYSLNEGDRIYFTDADGNRFEYFVAAVEILSPYSAETMKDPGWDLSLFTCTYGGRNRVTVRCSKISSSCS